MRKELKVKSTPFIGRGKGIFTKAAKQNVEGKPCPPGYNTARDRCIADTDDVDGKVENQTSNSPTTIPNKDELSNAHTKVNSKFYDLLDGIKGVILERYDGSVAAEDSVRAKIKEKALEDIRKRMQPIPKKRQWEFFNAVNKYFRVSANRAVRFNSPEVLLMNKWAIISGSHDPLARAVQLRASKLFGIENYYMKKSNTPSEIESHEKAEKLANEFGDILDDYLKASYENTQEVLKNAGVEEMVLYRGMKLDSAKEIKEEVKLNLQPISSFSTNFFIAKEFTMGVNKGDAYKVDYDSIVTAVKIPRERIFSTPITGAGCLIESEVVLLGGDMNCRKIDINGKGLI